MRYLKFVISQKKKREKIKTENKKKLNKRVSKKPRKRNNQEIDGVRET